ncbi:ANTAR domain-containing protein [Streptomyces sp. NPDC059861]|uniref:ANTAR domain-containing protein n=1 Tax=Streptomyces sp. NPDC059861 TaxID=3346974 RepID=UPI003651685A
MSTSRVQPSLPEDSQDGTTARLERENAQLRHAVGSHAMVDQAIGVLIAIHGIPPAAGFEVLREVSRHTNVKLHTVAESLIGWAVGEQLPEHVGRALQEAVLRRSGPTGAERAG